MESNYLAVIGIREHNIRKYVVGAYSKSNHKSKDFQTFLHFGSAIAQICDYALKQPKLFKREVATSFLNAEEENAIKGIAKIVIEKLKK